MRTCQGRLRRFVEVTSASIQTQGGSPLWPCSRRRRGCTLRRMEDQTSGTWLEPKPATPLTGNEAFAATSLSVRDFWEWGYSDLRENITRGILAEFLVAKAVGDPSPLRHAWDNFDVTTPSGIRVEVKSSAYLQSWRQRQHSRITFAGLTGLAYSYETNEFAEEATLRADVYVFALNRFREPDRYDALDTRAWEFYVVPVRTLKDEGSPKSISKSFLDRLSISHVDFAGLASEIEAAGE